MTILLDFTMGSNLGFTPIAVEFHRTNHRVAGNYRSIFYVRYIDWFITTPLLLLDLLLTAGMPWPTIFFILLVDEIMSTSILRKHRTTLDHITLTCYSCHRSRRRASRK